MTHQAQEEFLDVHAMLEESMPKQRAGWFWYAAGAFILLVLLSALLRETLDKETGEEVVGFIQNLAMFGLIATLVILTWRAARRANLEQQQLEAIEELIQLRRWPQAAGLLEQMLSRPTRTPQARFQGLIYLAAVLGRYERFADAITVYDHLLSAEMLDPQTAYGLRLGRAMSLLREDRLFDADRAIGELRRLTGDGESPGLALLEIYRDVKTGHPEEAVAIFNDKREPMRRQLGHRLADAHALAARAYDMLNQPEEAQRQWENATVLAEVTELARRYPELAPLVGKYKADPAASWNASTGSAPPGPEAQPMIELPAGPAAPPPPEVA